MRTMKARLLSLILAVMMIVSMLPATALATETELATGENETPVMELTSLEGYEAFIDADKDAAYDEGEALYATLFAAVKAVPANDTEIVLLKDVTVTNKSPYSTGGYAMRINSSSANITHGYSFTINLNNNTMTSTDAIMLMGSAGKTADVTIKNGTINASLGAKNKASAFSLGIGAKLTLQNVVMNMTNQYIYLSGATAKVILDGATVSTNYSSIVYINVAGEMDLTDGNPVVLKNGATLSTTSTEDGFINAKSSTVNGNVEMDATSKILHKTANVSQYCNFICSAAGYSISHATEADANGYYVTQAVQVGYTITWKALETDEEAFATTTVKPGEAIVAPEGTPQRAGYDFVGWDMETGATATADTTIVAKWQIKENLATFNMTAAGAVTGGSVTFADGATTAAVTEGSSVTIYAAAEEGYYVTSVTANGETLEANADGTYTYTPAADGIAVTAEFAQYQAKFENTAGEVTYYKDFNEIIAVIKTQSGTVTLLTDAEYAASNSNGKFGRNLAGTEANRKVLTLDLNGKTLNFDRCPFWTADYQDLTVKNGTLSTDSDRQSSTGNYVVCVNSPTSTVTLENLEVTGYKMQFVYASGTVASETAATVTIDDCQVTTTESAVIQLKTETYPVEVTVKNGSVLSSSSAVDIYSESHAVIMDSTSEIRSAAEADESSLAQVSASEAGKIVVCLPPAADGDPWVTKAVTAYTVTWQNANGDTLTTETVGEGIVPAYTGETPAKAADSEYAYYFKGWDKEITAVTGDVTYTAVFGQLPAAYVQETVTLKDEQSLTKLYGRPYYTDAGLHMEFGGAAFEFVADLGGVLTMDVTSQEAETYFQVYVDGQKGNRVYVGSGESTVVLAEDLTAEQHTIRVVRDTDAAKAGQVMAVSAVTFYGKKETMQATADKELLIEFVGDSITQGKYTEMSLTGNAVHASTNSYAYQTAQAMNADWSLVARGGCGYFRNTSCPKRMYELYPYYNGFQDTPTAYVPARQADVVVLALGTNDGADAITAVTDAEGNVLFDTFEEGVKYSIGQIRAMHGEDVKIVLLQNMMNGNWETELQNVAQEEGTYFLKVTQGKGTFVDGVEVNSHPTTAEHTVIAGELTEFLQNTVLSTGTYTVTADTEVVGGTVTFADGETTATVNKGQSVTVNVAVNDGYVLKSVTAGGKTLEKNDDGAYIYFPEEDNTVVTAEFAARPFKFTAENGTVTYYDTFVEIQAVIKNTNGTVLMQTDMVFDGKNASGAVGNGRLGRQATAGTADARRTLVFDLGGNTLTIDRTAFWTVAYMDMTIQNGKIVTEKDRQTSTGNYVVALAHPTSTVTMKDLEAELYSMNFYSSSGTVAAEGNATAVIDNCQVTCISTGTAEQVLLLNSATFATTLTVKNGTTLNGVVTFTSANDNDKILLDATSCFITTKDTNDEKLAKCFTEEEKSVVRQQAPAEEGGTYTLKVVPAYTLTWDVDGVTTTEDLAEGDVITLPEEPTKTDWTFNGWQGYTEGMTMPAEDITLTATWKPYVPAYAITIGEVTNGTVSVSDEMPEMDATVTVTATANSGYEMTGIYVDGTKIEGNTFTMPAKEVTVTAEFAEKQEASYKVGEETVTGNLINMLTASQTNPGGTLTLLTDVQVGVGYSFVGEGYDAANSRSYRIRFAKGFTLDLNGKTLTAAEGGGVRMLVADESSQTLTITDTSAAKGGKIHATGTNNYALSVEGADLVLENVILESSRAAVNTKKTPNAVTIKGCTLIANGGTSLDRPVLAIAGEGNEHAVVTIENTTIYANATASIEDKTGGFPTAVQLNSGDMVLGGGNTFYYGAMNDSWLYQVEGATATYTVADGYELVIDEENHIAKTQKLAPKTATVKFVNEDGTELQSSEVAYGENPVYTGETPVKAADAQYTYTFTGWTPEVTEVTGDVTYTATYTKTLNKYTVKFVNEDGTELQSSEVAYGENPAYTGETPAKAADAQYTYTFKGWTPAITPVTGDVTYTAEYTAEAIVVEPAAVLKAFTLGVEDEIVLNFKLTIAEELVNNDAAYVKLTKLLTDKNREDVKIITMAELREAGKDAKGRYTASIGMAGPQMTYDVALEIIDGNGEAVVLNDATAYGNNETGTRLTRAAQDYYKDMLSRTTTTAELKSLLAAMMVYGGEAQKYFGWDVANPVSNLLSSYGVAAPDLSGITAADLKQRVSYGGSNIGVEYNAQTVALESAVYMNVFFKLTGEKGIEEYTITRTYHENGVVKTMELAAEYDSAKDRYKVVLENIAAAYWDYMYDIEITDKESGESYTISTCVMAYCGDKYESIPTLQGLFRAMYNYNKEAKIYFNKTH